MVCRIVVFFATLAAVAVPAMADLLQLKDGRVIEGVPMALEGDSILLKYANGTVKVPRDRVEDYLIEGVAPPEADTEEGRAKRAEGLVPFRNRWVRPDVRERELRKEAEARRKAIEEARKHQEWMNRYTFKTRNFEFESTCPEAVNEEFSDLLETYYKEFSRLWRVSVPRDWGRLKVCFHISQEDFRRISGAGRGVLAYYRFVEPRELHFYYDRRNPRMTVATMFHEANHYLTDLMDDRFQYPHWINEAMAEYYGASKWDPERKSIATGGVHPYRIAEIQSDVAGGKFLGLREMITSEGGRYEDYYWGWSFVHFMMETPKYRTKFMRFFADLARARDIDRTQGSFNFRQVRGKECLRAFLTRLDLREENLPDLEEEWYAYVQGLGDATLAGLEEGGIRAFREGRWKFRAPRLLKEALDKGSRNIQAWICYARSIAYKDESGAGREEALKIMEKACDMDPLEPDAWAWRGSMLSMLGRSEEGKRMLDLAREMNPEDDYLWIEVQMKLEQEGGGGD